MKLVPVMVLLIVVLALSGCSAPPHKVVVTVGPSASPAALTATPTPVPAPRTTVTASGGVTTARGSGTQLVYGIRLGEGIYIINWSGDGALDGLSLIDTNGNGATGLSKGRASGEGILVVDDKSAQPGNFTLAVISGSGWAVNIYRPDTSSPYSLPLSLSCDEKYGAVTKPFEARAGDAKISYTLSRAPSGEGHVYIYDADTGQSVYTRPITGGYVSGQSIAIIPSDGVYIARVELPAGAMYADITISQES